MSLALKVEQRLLRRRNALSDASPTEDQPVPADIDLRIQLTDTLELPFSPTLTIAFDGQADHGAVAALAAGRLPDIEILLDGQVFERGAPMVDNRVLASAGCDDVFARAITLMLKSAARLAVGDRETIADRPSCLHSPRFTTAYVRSALPRIAREVVRRARYRFAHWRVGYRFIDGVGVAETGTVGSGWSVLPDDGRHFYADPFPFAHNGKHYIFVEDYLHATGKAVISVSRIGDDGSAGVPEPVLEEPHHLSYPQVFRHGGDIWMLPEGSQGGQLVLYRAERFPDRWVRAASLVPGEISDATLLEYGDRHWLFATSRDGVGSTSDTLVVYYANSLLGPWTPHPSNPVLVDRRRSRPGGGFVQIDGEWILPIQDGTTGYGGGLGLSRIVRLDDTTVELSDPTPIAAAGDFPYRRIHTLNRAGRLEVIDGIAAVRR